MKLLLVHPGASYATGDILSGYYRALVDAGHEVILYALDHRIDVANEFYTWAYKKAGHQHPPPAVVLQHAAGHIVPMALYHDVAGVVAFSGMVLAPDVFVMLKRAGMPTALILSESPYDDLPHRRLIARRDKGRPVIDAVFTNERTSVAVLGAAHPNVSYLPHAYDPAVSAPGDEAFDCDVLFIGSLFEERIALLEAIDWAGEGIDLALYGYTKTLNSRSRLRKCIRGGIVDNVDCQPRYRAARIVLNPYRTSMGFGAGVDHVRTAESVNPRALELAACGAFTISTYRPEVAELFGDLVPTYRTPGELLALVRYYLEHEEERRDKASRLPGAVTGHTYADRARDLVARLAAAWDRAGHRVPA